MVGQPFSFFVSLVPTTSFYRTVNFLLTSLIPADDDARLRALDRYQLLEPFTLEVTLDSGATNRLVGFHAIAEERLAELDAATLGKLNVDGHLLPIYMAVASLANLPALIARKNRRG